MELKDKLTEMLTNLIKEAPEGNKKYIFITDSQKLCEHIITCGCMAAFVNSENVDKFNNWIGDSLIKGTMISQYKFLPVTSSKAVNEKIIEVLTSRQGLTPLYSTEYPTSCAMLMTGT